MVNIANSWLTYATKINKNRKTSCFHLKKGGGAGVRKDDVIQGEVGLSQMTRDEGLKHAKTG